MPGKHVRFEGIPSTPPSTFSQHSSLPSEEGPITPPPLQHFGSPYALTPLPSVPSSIHAALGASHAPAVHYDLLFPVDCLQPHPSLSAIFLTEPATYPLLPSMTIVCGPLPWSIRVTASGNSKVAPFVTVMDVFSAIYHSLRTCVTGTEFEKVRTLEEQHRISDAYRKRYTKLRDVVGYEQEKSKGLKRVDFLMGKNRFAGLSKAVEDPERWVLNVL